MMQDLSSQVRRALKEGPVYEVFAPKPERRQPLKEDQVYLHLAVVGFKENSEIGRETLVYADVTSGEDFLMRRMRRKEIKNKIGQNAMKHITQYPNGLFGIALGTQFVDPRTKDTYSPKAELNLAALQKGSPLLR